MITPRLLLTSAFISLLPGRLLASGDYWSPPTYLDGAGHELKGTPEFFWHEEVRRLAAKYRDKESEGLKVSGAAAADGFVGYSYTAMPPEPDAAAPRAATAVDLTDFAEALASGRLKPMDPSAATAAHRAAREAIDSRLPLPGGEADSEFADYHAGAVAPDSPDAAAAWTKLLARPAAERHYRSVWATFMLGKRALTDKDWAGAVKRFEECRALARAGFADSLSLAADSYGWQGRAELMARHYPSAARLYLTQLALGDPSAIVSLKRLIPGWTSSSSGGLPGEAMAEEGAAAAPPADANQPADVLDARWLEAARDPVLQQLVTAHVLATDSAYYSAEADRCLLWLDVIEKSGVQKVEDATRLAWVAYTAGNYDAAKSWQAKADGQSALGQWLEAKFALREGKLDAAGKLLPRVAADLPPDPPRESTVTPPERVLGEEAALQYARGEFAEAFDTFVRARADVDAQFMIESILTVDEVLAAGAKIPRPKPAEEAGGNDADNYRFAELRAQIGRRLVREGKVKQARDFLTEEQGKTMDEYIAFAVEAERKGAPATERAKAWWHAGQIMKDSGHEFRGTEEDAHRPSDEPADWTIRGQRLTGKFRGETDYSTDPPSSPEPSPVFLRPGGDEKKRLAATASQHAKPARTRMVAASHLRKAAALLPRGSEEKARVLNTAGFWLQDIDNPQADRIYNQIEGELGNTPTGKAVLQKHWFTGGDADPWAP